MMRFWGKILSEVGFEPTIPDIPRSHITQEPQRNFRERWSPTLQMGARGCMESGALDRSAIPTHIDK